MGKGNRFDAAMGVLERYGGKLQSMTYLVAIKDAFTDLMPIIIIGSFATLINNVVCSTSNGLAQFAGFEFLNQFSGIFSAINYATMNFLAIYLVYRLGHRMAEIRETGSAVLSGFVALACYMSLVPPTASASSAAGEAVSISNVVASGYTNSQGMFMALIVGIGSAELFSALIRSGKMEIKMPESVPSGVSKSFAVLFPGMLTALIFGVIGFRAEPAAGHPLRPGPHDHGGHRVCGHSHGLCRGGHDHRSLHRSAHHQRLSDHGGQHRGSDHADHLHHRVDPDLHSFCKAFKQAAGGITEALS